MLRLFGFAALALLVATDGTTRGDGPAATEGPPAWQDQASVYLTMNDATALPTPLQQAPAASDERRLAPPSDTRLATSAAYGGARPRDGDEPRHTADFGLPLNTAYTMVSALAIAIGAFLLCAWLLKRGGRGAAQTLPPEAVGVLGRVMLDPRQFAQLLRVGNKLVLISLTPSGAETLTEVTDPVEVDRLVGLCQQSSPHSTTKAFEQVFQQLSREPAPSGFLGGALPQATSMPSLDMFRPQRGEAARA
jgi:flagellar biogenesis protein FliO